jgi:hypothetical protein
VACPFGHLWCGYAGVKPCRNCGMTQVIRPPGQRRPLLSGGQRDSTRPPPDIRVGVVRYGPGSARDQPAAGTAPRDEMRRVRLLWAFIAMRPAVVKVR